MLFYANKDEQDNGWTLSIKFLEKIQNELEETELTVIPSLEQIEDVLLVSERFR